MGGGEWEAIKEVVTDFFSWNAFHCLRSKSNSAGFVLYTRPVQTETVGELEQYLLPLEVESQLAGDYSQRFGPINHWTH